jgi:hypothetical protein
MTVELLTAGVPTLLASPGYPLPVYYEYSVNGTPGVTEFIVSVDVANITGLFGYGIGFAFDQYSLQVLDITFGSFLNSTGAKSYNFPGGIDNSLGQVTNFAQTLTLDNASYAPSVHGSQLGNLLNVTFIINPTLWPPYSDGYPGGVVPMVQFETDLGTALYNNTGNGYPVPTTVLENGTFQLTVPPPTPPTAAFGLSAYTAYVGTEIIYYTSLSTPGYNGWANVPIEYYYWNLGDGTIFSTTNPTIFHSYGAPGTYVIQLIVEDQDGLFSAPAYVSITINPLPFGCFIDLTTQNWRYIDPITLQPVLNGFGPNTEAEIFRPGDMVHLYANLTYNGGWVANQLVSFEVFDNLGDPVLVGTAISNATGIAEYSFRIPYPSSNVQSEFGWWSAIATWSVGSNFGPWSETTQNDTIRWQVGWGLWINVATLSIRLTGGIPGYVPPTYTRTSGDYNKVYVKVNVENDYTYAVTALVTADLYDNLLVPLGGPAAMTYTFNPLSTTTIVLGPITIPGWAFVGPGEVKVNVLSTWPSNSGTSFCPEQIAPLTILTK